MALGFEQLFEQFFNAGVLTFGYGMSVITLPQTAHFAGSVVFYGLPQLRLRVHHKRDLAGYRFVDRFTAENQ